MSSVLWGGSQQLNQWAESTVSDCYRKKLSIYAADTDARRACADSRLRSSLPHNDFDIQQGEGPAGTRPRPFLVVAIFFWERVSKDPEGVCFCHV